MPIRTTLTLCAGLSLATFTSAAYAGDSETTAGDAARKTAAASKRGAAAAAAAAEPSTVAGTIRGAEDPGSFIGRFTLTQERAILRTGEPTVEIVPGTSLVATFPSNCVTIWNGIYAEPHTCTAADLAGRWYAPFATFAEGSIRLELPSAAVSQAFSLTRDLKPISLDFYSSYKETADLGAARTWMENPGDWVSERKAGKDGVTFTGAADALEYKAPFGSFVCANPAVMDGLAPRGKVWDCEDPSSKKVAAKLRSEYADVYGENWSVDENDPRFRRVTCPDYNVGLEATWLLSKMVTTIVAPITMVGGIESRSNSMLWGSIGALGAFWVVGPPIRTMHEKSKYTRVLKAANTEYQNLYNEDGMDAAGLGGGMVCTSVPRSGVTKLELRKDAPAGQKFSPVVIWAPTYPSQWRSITKMSNAESQGLGMRIRVEQLKELFNY
jgi:hypothetical protein